MISPIGKFLITGCIGHLPVARTDQQRRGRRCGLSGQPSHATDRIAGDRIDAATADAESVLFVEANRAGVVGVDIEMKPPGGDALCLRHQRSADTASPMLRRDHDLVEIARTRIDRYESDQGAGRFRDRNLGRWHELFAPAHTPPSEPSGEVKRWIGNLPGAQPERYGGVLIMFHVRPQAYILAAGFHVRFLSVNAGQQASSGELTANRHAFASEHLLRNE